MTLAHYTSWEPLWEPLSLVLTAGAIWLTARGVRLSTSAVGLAVVVQVAIMLVVCVVTLIAGVNSLKMNERAPRSLPWACERPDSARWGGA